MAAAVERAIEELAHEFARRLLALAQQTTLEEIARVRETAKLEATRRRAPHRRSIESHVQEWSERYALSPSEREILAAAAHGKSRDDLVRARHVTRSTLKRQVFTLLRKTGDASLMHAVARLLREVLGHTSSRRRRTRRTQAR